LSSYLIRMRFSDGNDVSLIDGLGALHGL